MSDPEEALRTYCEDIEDQGAERVVARWIDETRPVEDDADGVTVAPVQRVTVKTAIDDEMVEETFEDVDYQTMREILESHDFETLFRSDNLTRRDRF
jgi:hypothetical protein